MRRTAFRANEHEHVALYLPNLTSYECPVGLRTTTSSGLTDPEADEGLESQSAEHWGERESEHPQMLLSSHSLPTFRVSAVPPPSPSLLPSPSSPPTHPPLCLPCQIALLASGPQQVSFLRNQASKLCSSQNQI